MATVTAGELRRRTRWVLDLVESGTDVTVTVDGRPNGRIVPVSAKPRWMSRDALFERVRRIQADAGLASVVQSRSLPKPASPRAYEPTCGMSSGEVQPPAPAR